MPSRRPLAVVLVASASLLGLLLHQSLGSSSSSAAPPIDAPQAERVPTPAGPLPPPAQGGDANGHLPDGATAFDDALPAIANLDPRLLGALRRASLDAEEDGVEIVVNSGWRSPEYQEQLLRQAISEHGSRAAAARWVAPPERSAHVSGDAVDLGPKEATAWLSEHGADYGLCRTYRNEPWHFELRLDAVHEGCPPMYADPTHDPRVQQ